MSQSAAPSPAPPEEAVAPLTRGLSVLRALTDAEGRASAGELSRTVGLARATTDRITATLACMGYVRVEEGEVLLLPAAMELGNAYLSALRLPDLLEEHAERLADAVNLPVSLTVSDGAGARVVQQISHHRSIGPGFRIGDLLAADHAAPVAVLAAGWEDAEWAAWRSTWGAQSGGELRERAAAARRLGWSVDAAERTSGPVSMSMPVRMPSGAVGCAVTVSGHLDRHPVDGFRDMVLPLLLASVTAMEEALRVGSSRPSATPGVAPGPALAAWANAAKERWGRDFVESLARGLGVITAFGEGREALTAGAVATATGLPRATVRRSLITLEHLGYVTVERRAHRLTPRVLGLGFAPLSGTTLAELAQPHLTALMTRLQDSASMAVLAGEDIRYTARAAARRVMSVDITAGTRFPAHATSMGRILLAGLPDTERAAWLARASLHPLTADTVTAPDDLDALLRQVRERGHALTDGELEESLRSLAVPVRGPDGQVIAAMNVAMHRGRRTLEACLGEVLPELRATAELLERDIKVTTRFVRLPEI
ncbi:IclR family transcriptional regulator C-terminal domain-containing protein [Streptomyces sp. AS02]|uniref:IclR family transcriptional regulator domain-containing protein n=1 Tax=Streptomyces sp. AS02 TaxID=2938946 RepID=UPI00202297B8|nr:IclR family transcriptional regulator C-terminal domain-containing protein [Streptomyces sp. AS02]MCL8014897.1 helix-turn-helix domain-containing protein [Streptomyces sp. AS02]